MADIDRNAALCQWLGIEPKPDRGGDCNWCMSGEASAGYGCSCVPILVYPTLSTRENFWLVWDALKDKGYQVALETMSSRGVMLCCEISEATRESYKHWVTKLGNGAEVVLPEAALELMQIKKGGE